MNQKSSVIQILKSVPGVLTSDRTTSTPTNCNADCVINGRRQKVDSNLELTSVICLSADPNVLELREQQRFDWHDRDGVVHKHWFDFVASYRTGETIAYAVRPTARFSNSYADDLSLIRRQAIDSSTVHDMRVLDEHSFDPVTIFNAELLHESRQPELRVDSEAFRVVRAIKGAAKIEELSSLIGFGGSGFRAVVRLLRATVLASVRHERITPSTLVYKRSTV